MLTTRKDERRTRRQARFTLEALDDRLVLSAAGAGAAAEAAGVTTSHAAIMQQRHEARIARHEARLARIAARHEARLARIAARHAAPRAMPAPAMPIINGPMVSTPASTGTPAAPATSIPSMTSPAAGTPTSIGNVGPVVSTPVPTPTPSTSPAPLSANVAAALQSLYTEYENAGSGAFTPSQPIDKTMQISGSSVEVSLKIGPGTDFNTALAQLQGDGMQVSSSSATYDLIDGMLPIGQLPAAAQIASSVTPVPVPILQ